MNIVIPSLLRIKPDALNKVGKYLRSSDWSEVAVLWGEGLRERFGGTLGVSFDATDTRLLFEADATTHDIEALVRLSLKLPAQVKALVAIGGGRAIDCAKYLAHLIQKPLVSCQRQSRMMGSARRFLHCWSRASDARCVLCCPKESCSIRTSCANAP